VLLRRPFETPVSQHWQQPRNNMDLHGKIMNLPAGDPGLETRPERAYKLGHRDARHAAAELANAGDACADALRLFMSAGLGNSTDLDAQLKAYRAGVEALARLRG
jgi:hypothetical protein